MSRTDDANAIVADMISRLGIRKGQGGFNDAACALWPYAARLADSHRQLKKISRANARILERQPVARLAEVERAVAAMTEGLQPPAGAAAIATRHTDNSLSDYAGFLAAQIGSASNGNGHRPDTP